MDQSAAHDAGYAAGTLVGYLLIYGGLLGLGVFLGKRLARNRADVDFVRWPLGVALVLILLLLAGQCSRPSQARAVPTAIPLPGSTPSAR